MAIKANTAREHWANQVHQQSALTTVVHTHDWHQIDWITLWQNDGTVRTTKGRWRDVGRATATVAGSIACGRYTRKCFIVCSSAYLFCTDDWRPTTTMQLRLQLEPQTFLTVVSHPPFSPPLRFTTSPTLSVLHVDWVPPISQLSSLRTPSPVHIQHNHIHIAAQIVEGKGKCFNIMRFYSLAIKWA